LTQIFFCTEDFITFLLLSFLINKTRMDSLFLRFGSRFYRKGGWKFSINVCRCPLFSFWNPRNPIATMRGRFWCVSSHSNLAYQSPYRGESRATAISRWSSCRYSSGNIPGKCEIQKIRVYNTLAFSAKRDVNTRRQLLDKSRKSELV